MKRNEIIYDALQKYWAPKTKEIVLKEQGSSAADLEKSTGISRSNSSLELNRLVKDGLVVKIKKYPVKFIPVTVLKQNEINIPDKFITNDLNKKIESSILPQTTGDPFNQIIGSQQSLRTAVKQAKAAIMYPPTGLDMLLLGPTGSGKTFFANVIYEYSKFRNQISDTAPFITFNCADYYNNSQLLLSQLFGYVRGAYTGADKDKAGLVEKASGGVLLLDEVHRLPPEGQEMLFTFMDTGTFSRLGETGKRRQANVLIVAATNEDPKSNLLETFLRRIPTIIKIPSLSEKGLREQIQIINYLFRNESSRIRRDLDVSVDVIETLLFSDNYGNIGQLKSQIQLICARAFLNSIDEDGDVLVNRSTLPEELQKNKLRQTEKGLITQVTSLVPLHSIYSYDSRRTSLPIEKNIYQDMTKQVEQLKSQGMDNKDIQNSIMHELRQHINEFLKEPAETIKLQNFISPRVLNLTKKLYRIAEDNLNEKFDERFIYYIGMHIDTYLSNRNRETHVLMKNEVDRIQKDYKNEYIVAKLFSKEIYQEEDLILPNIEVIYLTLLLSSLEKMHTGSNNKVGILVIAHGNSTASSMVEVASELFGANNIASLDMSLNTSPTDIIDRMVEKINLLNQGCGVLLLVDMGSLVHLQEQIEKKTSIPIKIIPFVTTLIVLDTVRKTNYLDMDLTGLHNSIKNDFVETVTSSLRQSDSNLPKAILSICMTGSGTAERLKTIIVNIVNETTSEPVVVKTISALKLSEEIPKIKDKFDIIATVGTRKTNLKVPHITLESLIGGNGEEILRSTIGNKEITRKNTKHGHESIVISDICIDILKTSLIYLNPYLMTKTLIAWMNNLSSDMNVKFSNSMIVKCVVHTCFVFERALTKESIKYPNTPSEQIENIYQLVKKTLSPYEGQLKIQIPKDELYFISEIVSEESSNKKLKIFK
ncbi:sigma 54-interacting transcriptional regulator [Companilactobacillus jidongensis]|uniref:sigma 54-interacting transcriptional regulator n=1 Tax=Companilactobacillus jidongensis TaxID=2486006 RepID=UPI000F79FDC6|nr:sigma-54-dependent transcriptional regulator [Companilactobacillus jidongensis]